MSCWVVPALAAELWGMSLGQVLRGIKDGSIPWREEHGFAFVKAGPEAETLPAPVQHKAADRPSTFMLTHSQDDVTEEADSEVLSTGELEALTLPDWRQVRHTVGRTRIAPAMAA